MILDGFDEIGVCSVDLILLKEGLQESLKDWASELPIAFLPFDVGSDSIVVRGRSGFHGLRNVGYPHAASEDEVYSSSP